MNTKIMRQSALMCIEMCGEAYRRRYVEKEDYRYNYLALCGSASHTGRHHNFEQKIISHTDVSVSDVTDVCRDYVIQAFSDGEVSPDKEHSGLSKPSLRSETIDRSVRLTSADYYHFQTQIQPIDTEINIEVDIPGCDFSIAGVIDLVDDKYWLRDYKTKKATPGQNVADGSEQLTLYDLLFQAYYKREPSMIAMDCIVDLKRGPKAITLQTGRTAQDHQAILLRMAAAARAIEAGVFVPCESSHWKCSPNYCEYYADCKYVIG